MILPNLKFFEPKPVFFRELAKLVGDRMVIDCGAGVGHVSKALAGKGIKVRAIDTNLRERPVFDIQREDAVEFPFTDKTLALIARPCGGDWIRETMDNAIATGTQVVYVGVQKNFERDIEGLPYDVSLVSKAVGKEDEQMFLISGQKRSGKMKKSKTKCRRIKTAIIVDFMGSSMATPEDEVVAHKEKYGALLAPAVLDVHEPRHAWPGDYGIEEGTELVIYDFGGLMPGSSLMEDNARGVIEWANDHPNGLVIVASSFTYSHFIKREMKDMCLDLFNVVLDDYLADDPIPEWFKKV